MFSTGATAMVTRPSSSMRRPRSTSCGVRFFNTSSSAVGSPIKAPIAAAIGIPTMPVPGTVTPMPFFIKLGDTAALIRSGTTPSSRVAIAQASASEIGSVQPSAGAISFLAA
jgi:hypothetical protein